MLPSWIKISLFLPLVAITFVGDTAAKKRCKYYGYNLDPGHDITKLEDVTYLEDCCQRCLVNPQCKGFTHNRGHNCWLKYNDHPLVGDGRDDGWSTSSGLIEEVDERTLEEEAEAESRKACELLPNTNLDPGHDLRVYGSVTSFEECCNLCKTDTACKGFVHDNLNSCYLKFNDEPTIEDNGASHPSTGIIIVGRVKWNALPSAAPSVPSIEPARPAPTPAPTTPVYEPAPPPQHRQHASASVVVPPASPAFAAAAARKYGQVCRPFRLRTVEYKEMELYGYNISPGRDITVLHASSSFERCARACMRCNGCVAFVYDPTDSNCYLKDNSKIVAMDEDEDYDYGDGGAGGGSEVEYRGLSIGILTPEPESDF